MRYFRYILLAIAAGCFVMTAVNMVFALHIARHNHQENDCRGDCSICQYLFQETNAVYIQADPVIIFTKKSVSVTLISELHIDKAVFEPFMARPPPAAAV